MIYSLHRFGATFDEYFLFKYFEKNTIGRSQYVTDKVRWHYYDVLNDKDNLKLFDDKYETYKIYKQYYKRTCIKIARSEDKDLFVKFVNKYPTFIIKPLSESCGKGVEKISLDVECASSFFDRKISQGSYIVEEFIQQSEEMSTFHPQSLNTVRVPVVLSENGAEVVDPFLRVGVGSSIVDNAGAGGIFAAVDSASGVVISPGYKKGGETVEVHPDTLMNFVGFALPDWDEALALIHDLVEVFKGNRYFGWDLAHTNTGWLLVECNASGELYLSQTCHRKGLKNRFDKFVQEIK